MAKEKVMKFTVDGRLIGLNEYTKACRGNKYLANKLKKSQEVQILYGLSLTSKKCVFTSPVAISITWYEPNSRRDVDNVVFAKKFILDALVQAGVLKDDSQKYVKSFNELVLVDKNNPRIEVEIKEYKQWTEKQ